MPQGADNSPHSPEGQPAFPPLLMSWQTPGAHLHPDGPVNT